MIHSPRRSPSIWTARGSLEARLRAIVVLPAPGMPVMSHASWAGLLIVVMRLWESAAQSRAAGHP